MFHGSDGLRRMLGQDTLKPKSARETLGRFGSYIKPYWPAFVLVAFLVIVSTWANVTTPDMIGQLVDCYLTPTDTSSFGDFSSSFGSDEGSVSNCWMLEDVQPKGFTQNVMKFFLTLGDFPSPTLGSMTTADRLAGLGRVILIIIALYVIGAVLTGVMFYWTNWVGQHVMRTLRVKLLGHMHLLSMSFHTENEAGDLMSRITNDMTTIEQAVSMALINVLSGSLLLVWIAFNMFAKSVPFALLSFVIVPLMILATMYFSAQARKAFRVTRLEMGSVNAELQESISAVREVQAFNRAEENIENFRITNAANRDANIKAVAYTSALAPTLYSLGFLALAIVAGVGGYALLKGGTLFGSVVSIGLVITFLAYVQQFTRPIQQISVLWTNLQSAVAGAERIFGLLDEKPSIREKPNAITMPKIRGEVEFVNVSSSYNPDEPVLKDISFKAEPGQTIAIVGPTGAGKTTIINLIPRFYDITDGKVLVDGHDVRDVNARSLREQIGIVLQDTFLFGTTVMENLRFGRPDASDDEVLAAAKLAHADTFIERLPEKYETVLGERGSGLSQGQRQLIAIARAALADPRILILDEATSSVDTRTERLIQKALNELLKGRTSFVIAHRLSTIRNADELLVLDQGEIVERGVHEDLLTKKGFYYDLYMSQFWREVNSEGDE